MDNDRFDALTRSLATAGSRRQTLRGLAAAAAALLLGGGGAVAACPRGKKRCGEKCIPDSGCCTQPKRSRWIRHGEEYRQCGICLRGKLVKDPVDCLVIDPEGCTNCESGTFRCVPASDGARCGDCGTCEGGLCEPDETRTCGDICCPNATPVCIDPSAEQCCTQAKACGTDCCKTDSGFGEDGEVCTRDGCCLQEKAASNCRADDPNCDEKICCAAVWTQEGRGLACNPGADVPPETRAYCCAPGNTCCFTGCCPDGSRCCGKGTCCPDGDSCGSASCFAPIPDHV